MFTDYISVHSVKPGGVRDGDCININGRWLVKTGSPPLPDRNSISTLRFLFSKPPTSNPKSLSERVVLCCDCVCPRKDVPEKEKPECDRFSFGLCVDATLAANELRALSLRTIGTFAGVSKQRIDILIKEAQKELIRRVLADPELAEFCEAVGVGSGQVTANS